MLPGCHFRVHVCMRGVSHQSLLHEVELRQCVFCKEPLSFWFASRLRLVGLLGSEYKHCAAKILIPLSQDVPNLSPEKCVRVHAILCPPDCLLTPPTTEEHLANGRPHLDCHHFFCFGFLSVIRTTLVELVRHSALELDFLKTNPAMSMLTTNCSKNWSTRGTKLSVLHTIVFPSLVKGGF